MATCKDCYHYSVCENLIEKGLPFLDNRYPAEKYCFKFKDKSLVLELPCKIGTKIYFVCEQIKNRQFEKYAVKRLNDYPNDRGIVELTVSGYKKTADYFSMKFKETELYIEKMDGIEGKNGVFTFFQLNTNKIGKTVFFSLSKAEKALAERNSNE